MVSEFAGCAINWGTDCTRVAKAVLKESSYKHICVIVLEGLPNSVRFGLCFSKSVVNLRVCGIPELSKLVVGSICNYLSCWGGCGAILQS